MRWFETRLAAVEQQQLDRIEATINSILETLTQQEKTMPVSKQLQTLIDQVTATVGINKSAVAAIEGLSQQVNDLAASGGTPQQFLDLAAQMKASADALAAAIPQNQPPPAPPAA
jgi:uncharacterized coiled-coil protein SlyX